MSLDLDHTTIVQKYQEGKSGMTVATEVGVSFSQVYKVLRKLGVPTRPPQKTPKAPPAPKPPRVVDRVLGFLAEHPRSTVGQIAEGIGHAKQATVGQLLSRLKADGFVVSEAGPTSNHLYLLPEEMVATV